MPSPKQVTAIFDIGKTNKKFLLFDEEYTVIEKHQTELEQISDDDGDPCEDLEKLESWIKDQINKAEEKYQIQGLNFSGYGASLVHLDEKGEPVTPLYNYLKSYPEDLLKQFYESVDGKEKFSLQTASPPMGMLNSGLQLYWLKHQKPELFSKIEIALHFPNYLSYLFSERESSELTSIGCHTGLWDFEKMSYHHWLMDEDVQDLLPSPTSVNQTVEKGDMKIGPGIHDSSAALAPYLIGMNDPFMLISTGTWSITLNPFNEEPLAYEELEKDCLCYLDIYGNQVKASRLFLGAEYSHQKKKIEEYFGEKIQEDELDLELELINERVLVTDREQKLQLEKAYNSGPYPQEKKGDWKLEQFPSSKKAYYQLMLDLVTIQSESIKLAEGSGKVDKMIVTGGFSQNEFFVSLLATFFPYKKIYTSSLSDASALGAAMVLNENTVIANGVKQSQDDGAEQRMGIASQPRNDLKELLGLKKVNAIEGLNLKNYSWV